MARANLCCRMGERVMLLLGEFEARSFEELFQGVKALPLEDYIPKNGAFPVKGYSLESQLHSVPDCQAIIKKAAVTRLQDHYSASAGCLRPARRYQLRFSIHERPRSRSSSTPPASACTSGATARSRTSRRCTRQWPPRW
jgi:putative N6-adenine-specific DNA methylase